ncbi:deoxyuridine 5'-triphosphate nucleotidohydrolase-like [Hydra vulgaris]|uniref:Deoxyuridine 5'-triphosphate nucleotidohydrolase n=1 Tax=Hydra vulgaris TaxID=6087 RepID=A0ABM4CM68_HYDVU
MWIDTEFVTSIPLLPYINELFNRALNEKIMKMKSVGEWSLYEVVEIKTIQIRDNQEWSYYETKKSACFDLRSTKHYILQPDEHLVGQICSKSSIALKYGVIVFNAPAIIDADYKDKNKVLLINHSKEDYVINCGDAVAQMGFLKTFKAVETVIEIDGCSCREITMSMIKDVERNGGFGSTGK